MNDFPWTPQHEQPKQPVILAEPLMDEATEEVVLDSGDQPTPEEAEVVVDKPAPPEPAAEKAAPPKRRVRKAKKDAR